MRAMFDNGEDPMDAEDKMEREKQKRNPFANFFRQGGGPRFRQRRGGFNFNFGG